MKLDLAPLTIAAVLALGSAACGSSVGPSPTPTDSARSPAVEASSARTTPVEVGSPTATATSTPSTTRALDAHLVGSDGAVNLAVDAAGTLYVSQCLWTYAAIHRIDATGMMTIYAGTGEPGYTGDGGPATSAQLFCPLGMAFGPDGALYFADHINNRIRRIDAAGIITTIAGSGPAGLNLGSFSGDGGQATKATLQEPTAVAFDKAGNLYISDRDNNRVRKVDRKGIISTIAGDDTAGYSGDGALGSRASIDQPAGLVVDARGDVIFVDSDNLRVRKVDPRGIITTIAGTGWNASTGDRGPATKAEIAPGDVALDSADNLYVTDDASHSLRRIDRRGTITTVVGNGTAGVPEDGMAALKAPFARASSPTFDKAGNLYVTDLTSVYRIDKSGIVTRVAGKRD